MAKDADTTPQPMVGDTPRDHFNVAPATFVPSKIRVQTEDGSVVYRDATEEEIQDFLNREAYG